jgi:hypothetical protein
MPNMFKKCIFASVFIDRFIFTEIIQLKWKKLEKL